MRALLAFSALGAILMGGTPVQAEKRIFIIANNADGYGVDRCLATGAGCGKPFANAYCRSHDFIQADTFRKIDRSEITGTIPATAGASCRSGTCGDFVAIECVR